MKCLALRQCNFESPEDEILTYENAAGTSTGHDSITIYRTCCLGEHFADQHEIMPRFMRGPHETRVATESCAERAYGLYLLDEYLLDNYNDPLNLFASSTNLLLSGPSVAFKTEAITSRARFEAHTRDVYTHLKNRYFIHEVHLEKTASAQT